MNFKREARVPWQDHAGSEGDEMNQPLATPLYESVKPHEHPLKGRLRAVGIRQVDAARLIGAEITSLNQWLLGYRRMPDLIEFRLEELIKAKEVSHAVL